MTTWFRLLVLGALTALALARPGIAAPATLPIYLEESHAGSFHWLAQRLDLDAEHALVLFDAHSDASGIFGSDEIRVKLRRVVSREERQERLDRWRKEGAVQCFDWIEPLMPAPFARVTWVPAERLSRSEAWLREKSAGEYLDAHQEARPREAGPLAKRYQARSFEVLRREWRDDGTPLVVSIDLDYFAGMPPARQAAEWERMWDWTTRRPSLRAVTISISRPWLRDEAEAHRLVETALRGALSLPAAAVQFEPFLSAGPDRSELAKRLRAQGRPVPAWDVAGAPESLRAMILARRERIRVEHDPARWQALLGEWERASPTPRLELRGRVPSLDGAWRIPADEHAELEVTAGIDGAAAPLVEWVALTPLHPRCNLLATDDSWTGFAAGAPPRPRWRETILPGRGPRLDLAAARALFDPATGAGSVRFFARVRDPSGGRRETPPVEVRRFVGEGFQAALSEQFGLPYLLGGSALSDGSSTGPDTGWGADCANFVVAALRRSGRRLPWCDPKQLRAHLSLLASGTRLSASRITPAQVASGLIVHLGSHVAAVVEDRPPLGVLDAEDLVAHQLEGVPERVPLGRLLAQRRATRFDLYTADAPVGDRVLIGGDVMLGRGPGEQIARGENPLAGLAPLLRGAAVVAVNLECVPSVAGEPAAGRRFHLRAPLAAAGSLAAAGVTVASLANNHAEDFGDAGLREALDGLGASGVRAVGAGASEADAFAPTVVPLPNGATVAFIAITDVDAGPPALSGMHLARAARREVLAAALERAKSEADAVVCLVHWGIEGAAEPSDEQRELGRWLVDHGADAVAGAHPHRLQPLDFRRGAPVAFSLGNLVFDGAPAVSWWNRGALLELTIAPGRGVLASRVVPVQLDACGLPAPLSGAPRSP